VQHLEPFIHSRKWMIRSSQGTLRLMFEERR
jgi:hypothetical protein